MTDQPQTPRPVRRVDPRAARFAQGATATLLAAAFLLDRALLVPLVALTLLAPVLLGPKANVWARLFTQGLRPLLRLGAPAKTKDVAPIRFAQTLGVLFLVPASLLLLLPAVGAALTLTAATATLIAWSLALAVAALAGLAAATDLCLGCILYSVVLRARRAPAPTTEGRP